MTYFLWYYCSSTVLGGNNKYYMGGAEAEMMDKGGAAKEPKPEINNFGSTTLIFFNIKFTWKKFDFWFV